MLEVDISQLPSPGPAGGLQEVIFRRFLVKCIDKDASDGAERQRDPKYHHYVETLRKHLDKLKHQPTGQVDEGARHEYAQTLSAYERVTAALTDQLELPKVPEYVDPDPEDTPAQARAHAALAGQQQSERMVSVLQSPLGGNARLLNARHLSETAQKQLRIQEALQEALTDEMVEMSAALKQSAQAISAGLSVRNAHLDVAGSKLEKSAAGAQQAHKGAKAAVKRSSRSFWFTLFVMFAVGLAFVGMFAFIRVTTVAKHFVPYTSMAKGLFAPPGKPTKLQPAVPLPAAGPLPLSAPTTPAAQPAPLEHPQTPSLAPDPAVLISPAASHSTSVGSSDDTHHALEIASSAASAGDALTDTAASNPEHYASEVPPVDADSGHVDEAARPLDATPVDAAVEAAAVESHEPRAVTSVDEPARVEHADTASAGVGRLGESAEEPAEPASHAVSAPDETSIETGPVLLADEEAEDRLPESVPATVLDDAVLATNGPPPMPPPVEATTHPDGIPAVVAPVAQEDAAVLNSMRVAPSGSTHADSDDDSDASTQTHASSPLVGEQQAPLPDIDMPDSTAPTAADEDDSTASSVAPTAADEDDSTASSMTPSAAVEVDSTASSVSSIEASDSHTAALEQLPSALAPEAAPLEEAAAPDVTESIEHPSSEPDAAELSFSNPSTVPATSGQTVTAAAVRSGSETLPPLHPPPSSLSNPAATLTGARVDALHPQPPREGVHGSAQDEQGATTAELGEPSQDAVTRAESGLTAPAPSEPSSGVLEGAEETIPVSDSVVDSGTAVLPAETAASSKDVAASVPATTESAREEATDGLSALEHGQGAEDLGSPAKVSPEEGVTLTSGAGIDDDSSLSTAAEGTESDQAAAETFQHAHSAPAAASAVNLPADAEDALEAASEAEVEHTTTDVQKLELSAEDVPLAHGHDEPAVAVPSGDSAHSGNTGGAVREAREPTDAEIFRHEALRSTAEGAHTESATADSDAVVQPHGDLGTEVGSDAEAPDFEGSEKSASAVDELHSQVTPPSTTAASALPDEALEQSTTNLEIISDDDLPRDEL